VLEPAAGDGAIVRPLRAAGFGVVAQDICDCRGPLCCAAAANQLSRIHRLPAVFPPLAAVESVDLIPRLPMMHRRGWNGPKANSNTAFAWFIWDRRLAPTPPGGCRIGWFDWQEIAAFPYQNAAAHPCHGAVREKRK